MEWLRLEVYDINLILIQVINVREDNLLDSVKKIDRDKFVAVKKTDIKQIALLKTFLEALEIEYINPIDIEDKEMPW